MALLEKGMPSLMRLFVRNSSNIKSWPKYARGNWTPKVPKPPKLDHAGDVNLSLKPVDPTLPRPSIALSKLLSEADPVTNRICSLEYAPAKLATEYVKEEMTKKFERYPGDTTSLEVRIANATVFIRKYAEMCNKNTADKVAKVKLLMAIGRRHRLLTALRSENYDRFQYCLKELGVKWAPKPETREEKRRPTKREMRLKAVVDQCEASKKEKLEQVHAKYAKELEELRKNKDKVLRDVARSMQHYGISESDIFYADGTVKPVDLDAKVAAEQQTKWSQAEQKNLVRWMRTLQRPAPKMAFLTADLIASSEKITKPAA